MGQLHQGVIKTGREVREGKENSHTVSRQSRTHGDSHQVGHSCFVMGHNLLIGFLFAVGQNLGASSQECSSVGSNRSSNSSR